MFVKAGQSKSTILCFCHCSKKRDPKTTRPDAIVDNKVPAPAEHFSLALEAILFTTSSHAQAYLCRVRVVETRALFSHLGRLLLKQEALVLPRQYSSSTHRCQRCGNHSRASPGRRLGQSWPKRGRRARTPWVRRSVCVAGPQGCAGAQVDSADKQNMRNGLLQHFTLHVDFDLLNGF